MAVYAHNHADPTVGPWRFVRADSSDFGLLGEQGSPKWEILRLGRRCTAVKNLTPLALSSTEKSVTVQTNKNT